jgi:L-alanine-DL-glutamate epimerase-like enolase superfamily enzyme
MIKEIKVVKLRMKLRSDGEFWEEKFVSPADVYPELKGQWHSPFKPLRRISGNLFEVSDYFLEVISDDNYTGISGPLGPYEDLELVYILNYLKKILIGRDEFELEKIWDMLYRITMFGRRGDAVKAISRIDIALWDLLGKKLRKPVYKLLKGPSREKVRAYFSAAGFSTDRESLKKTLNYYLDKGFTAFKFFFKYGPSDGIEGLRKNVELVKMVREMIGEENEIMFDCWMGWDLDYSIRAIREISKYGVKWIEEPLPPDEKEGYSVLSSKSDIDISAGEHEYTRWGIKELIDIGKVRIVQPDISWVGGITEMEKIYSLVNSYGRILIPHFSIGTVTANIHFMFSKPSYNCPLIEYLPKYTQLNLAAFKDPVNYENGHITLPKGEGLSLEYDEEKVIERKVVSSIQAY